MTGNQVKGKSFRGALRYNLEKVDNKVAEVLVHSFVKVSEKDIFITWNILSSNHIVGEKYPNNGRLPL
jgi:hypothetical protein